MSVSEGQPVLTPEIRGRRWLEDVKVNGGPLEREFAAAILSELAREREARERLDRELHEALAMPVLAEERVRELGADRKIALDALGKIAGGQDYGQPRRFARQVIEAQGWAEALVGLPERQT